jgi:uncharacterized membrane protein YkoI
MAHPPLPTMRRKADQPARVSRIAAIAVALASAAAATARPVADAAVSADGALLVLAPTPPAVAAQLPNQRGLTLAEAILIAQRRHPGRVVRSQTVQQGNGAVHEIRIIGNDGVVHTVRVDARTGAVH